MKKKHVVFAMLFCLMIAASFSIDTKQAQAQLPDMVVTVHGEFGLGLVANALVHITNVKAPTVELFDGPKLTGGSGSPWYGKAWFENNGMPFPNGAYKVTVTRPGFGDGVKYFNIVNGIPVYPKIDVNSGHAL